MCSKFGVFWEQNEGFDEVPAGQAEGWGSFQGKFMSGACLRGIKAQTKGEIVADLSHIPSPIFMYSLFRPTPFPP